MKGIQKINDFSIEKFCNENGIKDEVKTYIAIPQIWLLAWLQQKAKQNYALTPLKALPQTTKNFTEDDDFFSIAERNPKLCVISERIWGIKCGVTHLLDPFHCSLKEVTNAAQTDQLVDIYSPGYMRYYADGHREFQKDYLAVYNTECQLGCYKLIDKKQALVLFPLFKEILDSLPDNTSFLTDFQKVKIVNQEKNEIGLNFNLIDRHNDEDYANTEFFLGNLRPTFEYIAQKIQVGDTEDLYDFSCTTEIKQINKTICFAYGGYFTMRNALIVVSDEDAISLKENFITGSQDQLFGISCNGKYKKIDQGITICASYETYKQWGSPLTNEELDQINEPHEFQFIETDKLAPESIKLNQLRYTPRAMRKFQEINPSVKEGHIFTEEDSKLAQKKLAEIKEKEEEKARMEEEARRARYRVRDSSGPSRSSLMTETRFNRFL